ncbi:hypothetical protein AUC68_08985 [Methyloceanibacter methanicus]|uniref:Ceramidase n=1 Tax=Methyloceanibacter methanicus TaxID=1774968 RepID=A0A1E3VYD9_9HYPH|nr:ceramidase domain-containing protein [Methyloceanibacter methanicus]ODR98539.1 hypothetical protein AUC68_08985 [Methyloceanibacter methanicus]
MTLGERVYLYCERGTNEALWAEPINAISNAGFFLAALIFWQLVLWRPPEQRSADHYLFVALVFAICFGSVAFHVYADRGTELADVIPIAVFMLVYLGFALNRFLNVPPGWTVFLVVVFAGLIAGSMQIHCWDGGIGLAGGAPGAKVCLNGSVGYLPALGALIIVSMLVAERRHKAAPYLLAATVVFAVSILLRSLDMAYCSSIVVDGRNTGTHFIWHILNAIVLFLLMRASLETETKPLPAPVPVKEPAEEKPEEAPSEPESQPEAKDESKDAPKDEPKDEPAAKAGEAPKDDVADAPDDKTAPDDGAETEPSEDKEPEEAPAKDESSEAEPSDEESSDDEADKAEASKDESIEDKEPEDAPKPKGRAKKKPS